MSQPIEDGPPTLPEGLETVRHDSGLETIEIEEGTGDRPEPGSRVTLLCRGWLANGTPIEDSAGPEEPPEVVLGEESLIPGLAEGVLGMRVGGRRRLIIPSDLAYGARGKPGLVPPFATLIYDIQLVATR
jgi:peptidylprolyl isomerase